MAKRRAPLFLKRKGYRQRRLRDAARLLPILGGFLVLLPILWTPSGSSGIDTAWDGIYLFTVWIGLVVLAAALAPGLADDAPEADAGDGEPR